MSEQRTLLLTGGSGFIGSEVARIAAANAPSAVTANTL